MNKRPVAFRVPRLLGDMVSHYFVTTSEDEARAMADTNQVEYEGLYLVGDRIPAPAQPTRLGAINFQEIERIGGIAGGRNPDIAHALRILETNGLIDIAAQPPAAPVETTSAPEYDDKCEYYPYFEMLWKWFEERRGKEDMRANAIDGLSVDDFKSMLDEHEAALTAPQPTALAAKGEALTVAIANGLLDLPHSSAETREVDTFQSDKCPTCLGDGYIGQHANLPDVKCPNCSGTGFVDAGPNVELLIENLVQAAAEYENNCDRLVAKTIRVQLEKAKQAIRDAITTQPQRSAGTEDDHCPTCDLTHVEHERIIHKWCKDPFHQRATDIGKQRIRKFVVCGDCGLEEHCGERCPNAEISGQEG